MKLEYTVDTVICIMATMSCITVSVLVLLILLVRQTSETNVWLETYVDKMLWHRIHNAAWHIRDQTRRRPSWGKIRHHGTRGHDKMDSTSMPRCSSNSLMWLLWFLGWEELSGNSWERGWGEQNCGKFWLWGGYWELNMKQYYFEEDKVMLSGVFYMLYLWINLR